ncbi:hypothetical protein B0T10DRAFT_572385 [Thelonectria olida]|uniref:chitinase n=1 Tax=Thelonectria olida TaxID=1576542 RepID=A0A9P8VN64_9HYPO|nr:hypothetical protein B0T10DRAFT_572385 [Thelonectria olida]
MASSLDHQRLSLFALLTFLCSFLHFSPVLGYAQGHARHDHLHHLHDHYPRAVTLAATTASSSGQNDFTCGPDTPCSNEACCGEDGWCGYDPNYCGDGCQSNCDAKAECGQFAETAGKTCPLNVCCSQHGFCGTTAGFCNNGCQSNCDSPKPNAAPSNPQKVVIGYWETWNMVKPCGIMGPGEIPVELLTHLFVSFGYINSNLQTIGNVKSRNPNLKIVIALGGWTFSDPGPWQDKFPSLASTKENRATFINNLLGFLSEYGYDGVGNTKVRIDYSNVAGYWNAAVDSPGIQSGDSLSRRIAKRFFANSQADWRTMYKNAKVHGGDGERFIEKNIDTPLFWDTVQDCEFDGEDYELGFGAHVGGTLNADFTYGFSMIASMGNVFDVKQANGWLNVMESRILHFPSEASPVKLKGHTLSPSGNSWLSFQPYYKIDYMLASFNDTAGGSGSPSAPYFDGKLSTRIKSDFGGFNVNFPPNPSDRLGTRNVDRENNRVSMGNDNVIYNSGSAGGRFALSTWLGFGLKIDLGLFSDRRHFEIPIIDVCPPHSEPGTLTKWTFFPSPSLTPETCLNTSVSTIALQNYEMDDDKTIGWNESKALPYIVSDSQRKGDDNSCYRDQPSMGEDRAWGYGSDSNINPVMYMDEEAAKAIQDSNEELSCSTCLVCGKDRKKNNLCCGCANMDLDFGYTDIPTCESCAPEVDTGGPWPGRRSASSLSSRGAPELADGEGVSGLEKRVDGEATLSPKSIRVCPTAAGASGRKLTLYAKKWKYPAFPDNRKFQWENIEGGKWDSISRYWGNTSMSCSDWTVDGLQPHDTAWIEDANGDLEEVRANYQTEHDFEGQLIADFFNQWLDKGKIENQTPAPSNPTPKVPCRFTIQWILNQKTSWPWKLDGKSRAFIHLLLAELGNASNLDRLAILKGRPNRMKGGMFGGKQSTSLVVYAGMSAEKQLLATKEMGMVFEYMNNPTIWAKFCDTYEAMYKLFGDFDTFYATQGSGVTIPSLQKEWKEYIEVVLTSMVLRSKTAFELQTIIAIGGIFSFVPSMAIHGIHWVKNIGINQPKIRIDGTCLNLGAISNDG